MASSSVNPKYLANSLSSTPNSSKLFNPENKEALVIRSMPVNTAFFKYLLSFNAGTSISLSVLNILSEIYVPFPITLLKGASYSSISI